MEGIAQIPAKIPNVEFPVLCSIKGDVYPPSPVAFFAPSRRGYHMGIYIRRMSRVVIAYVKLKEPKLNSTEGPSQYPGYASLYATIKAIVDNNSYIGAQLRAQELYNEAGAMGAWELVDVLTCTAAALAGMRGKNVPDHPRCVGLAAWKIRQLIITYPDANGVAREDIKRVAPGYFMDFARGMTPVQ